MKKGIKICLPCKTELLKEHIFWLVLGTSDVKFIIVEKEKCQCGCHERTS